MTKIFKKSLITLLLACMLLSVGALFGCKETKRASIKVLQNTYLLDVGEEKEIPIEKTGVIKDGEIKITSYDESVALISSQKIIGAGEGSALVTVTFKDFEDTIWVRVVDRVKEFNDTLNKAKADAKLSVLQYAIDKDYEIKDFFVIDSATNVESVIAGVNYLKSEIDKASEADKLDEKVKYLKSEGILEVQTYAIEKGYAGELYLEEINNATTKEEVDAAVALIKSRIDTAVANDKALLELKEAKQKAIATVLAYAESKDMGEQVIDLSTIENATSLDGVANAVLDLKNWMDDKEVEYTILKAVNSAKAKAETTLNLAYATYPRHYVSVIEGKDLYHIDAELAAIDNCLEVVDVLNCVDASLLKLNTYYTQYDNAGKSIVDEFNDAMQRYAFIIEADFDEMIDGIIADPANAGYTWLKKEDMHKTSRLYSQKVNAISCHEYTEILDLLVFDVATPETNPNIVCDVDLNAITAKIEALYNEGGQALQDYIPSYLDIATLVSEIGSTVVVRPFMQKTDVPAEYERTEFDTYYSSYATLEEKCLQYETLLDAFFEKYLVYVAPSAQFTDALMEMDLQTRMQDESATLKIDTAQALIDEYKTFAPPTKIADYPIGFYDNVSALITEIQDEALNSFGKDVTDADDLLVVRAVYYYYDALVGIKTEYDALGITWTEMESVAVNVDAEIDKIFIGLTTGISEGKTARANAQVTFDSFLNNYGSLFYKTGTTDYDYVAIATKVTKYKDLVCSTQAFDLYDDYVAFYNANNTGFTATYETDMNALRDRYNELVGGNDSATFLYYYDAIETHDLLFSKYLFDAEDAHGIIGLVDEIDTLDFVNGDSAVLEQKVVDARTRYNALDDNVGKLYFGSANADRIEVKEKALIDKIIAEYKEEKNTALAMQYNTLVDTYPSNAANIYTELTTAQGNITAYVYTFSAPFIYATDLANFKTQIDALYTSGVTNMETVANA